MVLGVLEARLASVDRAAEAQQDTSTGDTAANGVPAPEITGSAAPADGDVSAIIQAATELISQGAASIGSSS